MRLAWRRTRRIVASALVAACAVMLCIGTGCDDNGTGPVDPPIPTGDYPVYVTDAMNNVLYSYWPARRTVDSVRLPFSCYNGVGASPDGERLYFADMYGITVTGKDPSKVRAILPYKSSEQPVVSPDGQYLALLGGHILILRTSDYSVVFSDPRACGSGRFGDDSKSLYVGAYDAVVVTIEDSVLTSKAFPGLAVRYVQPVNDGRNWLIYGHPDVGTSWFLDYDVERDSVVFVDTMEPGHGTLVVAPDGRRAYYTNPHDQYGGQGEMGFRVYDIEQHRVIDTVSTEIDWEGSAIKNFWPGAMEITPDGRYLVMRGMWDLDWRILTYDLLTEEFVDFHQLHPRYYYDY